MHWIDCWNGYCLDSPSTLSLLSIFPYLGLPFPSRYGTTPFKRGRFLSLGLRFDPLRYDMIFYCLLPCPPSPI
uniref:Uncharacterized protein n=1 Tax=Picea glauca TaxID=3330 RepID=A0A101M078_PICGL|nr:hypothetical protein ABT39_MTgene4480 [Picea glauca]